jgi:hypothetical protein
MGNWAAGALVAALLVLAHTRCEAQGVGPAALWLRGEVVRVKGARDAAWQQGRVLRIDSSGVTLRVAGHAGDDPVSLTFPVASIARMERRYSVAQDVTFASAGVGAVAGAMVFPMVARSLDHRARPRVHLLEGLALGAIVGLVAGSVRVEHRWIPVRWPM